MEKVFFDVVIPEDKKKPDTGSIAGDPLEMLVKYYVGIKDWRKVSPKGEPDFAIGTRHYDVKQNGSVIEYANVKGYIKGSSRVIYAPYVVRDIVRRDEHGYTFSINLMETEWYVVDKWAFVRFLRSMEGYTKMNRDGTEMTIQTLYNYTREKWHGKKGRVILEWLKENHIADDPVNDLIFANCED